MVGAALDRLVGLLSGQQDIDVEQPWGRAAQVFLLLLAGVVGGFAVAIGHAFFEHLWFYTLSYLERRGAIRRLAPSIPVTMVNYRKESFWAVAVGPMPIAAVVWLGRKAYLEKAQFVPSWSEAVSAWMFTWAVMFLHDLYFWAVHSVMHKFKAIYRNFHQWHHATKGDITVFSTAYGDLFDIALTFSPFYAALMFWLYRQASYNMLHLLFLAWAVNGVDLMGHCGYHLPLWVYGPGSLGVLLTPFAQRPKHHYIHHLDPRYNRSLYFTWWDILAGTYRDRHQKIEVYH